MRLLKDLPESKPMNFKIFLLPLALVVETIATPLRGGRELGFGNWVCDRKVGDPKGELWETRKEALKNQEESSRARD